MAISPKNIYFFVKLVIDKIMLICYIIISSTCIGLFSSVEMLDRL